MNVLSVRYGIDIAKDLANNASLFQSSTRGRKPLHLTGLAPNTNSGTENEVTATADGVYRVDSIFAVPAIPFPVVGSTVQSA